MEDLVKELLGRHKDDKNLTGETVQQEVKELRKKYKKFDKGLKDNEQLAGLDWSGADLSGFDLSGLYLSYTIHKAIFNSVDFSDANLSKVIAQDAKFKNAIFYRADLRGAVLCNSSFLNADMSFTYFDGANLGGAEVIRWNMEYATVPKTDFSNVNLEGTDISNCKVNFKMKH